MDVSKLCPSPHIEAAELKGEDVEVTITKVDIALVGDEKKQKGRVFFNEFDRGMVLNRTNSGSISLLHGRETDDWAGKVITLYPTVTQYKGKTVPCIRVREDVKK